MLQVGEEKAIEWWSEVVVKIQRMLMENQVLSTALKKENKTVRKVRALLDFLKS